ncbi:lysophospholipid acyltransferase family protein [Peptoniphilus equinus]|uniref:1-acyl-sn-glycerol-3-phosphate acyltransferase n=1 Tax=Peptoniphilus equinus TaxID=3016343 RepID=A0ABY7QXD8_9FIRM|nr:lysophospholipid acyltransferase family protein [Peptoniphilus equinus]WBW50608.1 lysophospholipid acyltransferase family protein [Peptoniphilus equinus]
MYKFLQAVLRIYFQIRHRVTVVGMETLPNEPFMVCANHLSNWDPLFITAFFPGTIAWMAKEELFHNPILDWLLHRLHAFPVDRQGADVKAIKTALKVLKGGGVLGIFPEGTRVRQPDIRAGKSGVAVIAHKAKVPIVPMTIEGNYKGFGIIVLRVHPCVNLPEDKRLSAETYQDITRHVMAQIYGVDDN